VTNPAEPIGERYKANVVCFCDIPVEDLAIHTAKYSRFGLAFLKDDLIPRGAGPVFYIDNRAPVSPSLNALMKRPTSREGIFDAGERVISGMLEGLKGGPSDATGEGAESKRRYWDEWNRLHDVFTFLGYYVFAFLKPFDATTADSDPENYYMEREWRVIGSLHFELPDVFRVFLPQEYARRFRDEVPEYAGQLTFV
jgi:Putative abortive phage resistance protein AbiGi, antitoxin